MFMTMSMFTNMAMNVMRITYVAYTGSFLFLMAKAAHKSYKELTKKIKDRRKELKGSKDKEFRLENKLRDEQPDFFCWGISWS